MYHRLPYMHFSDARRASCVQEHSEVNVHANMRDGKVGRRVMICHILSDQVHAYLSAVIPFKAREVRVDKGGASLHSSHINFYLTEEAFVAEELSTNLDFHQVLWISYGGINTQQDQIYGQTGTTARISRGSHIRPTSERRSLRMPLQ